jgi:xanthosine utilization system XapX-like protein
MLREDIIISMRKKFLVLFLAIVVISAVTVGIIYSRLQVDITAAVVVPIYILFVITSVFFGDKIISKKDTITLSPKTAIIAITIGSFAATIAHSIM